MNQELICYLTQCPLNSDNTAHGTTICEATKATFLFWLDKELEQKRFCIPQKCPIRIGITVLEDITNK